jgi:hypothetical protein
MLPALLAAQDLSIRRASAVADAVPTLQLVMSIKLGSRATEAIEAGLVLSFKVDWELADGRELQQSLLLRYSPLLRSYQLGIGQEVVQTFSLRNSLLAAMENARLRWPEARACAGECGGQVRVRLDPAALPAPLRLPALVDSDWRFDSDWHALATPIGAAP